MNKEYISYDSLVGWLPGVGWAYAQSDGIQSWVRACGAHSLCLCISRWIFLIFGEITSTFFLVLKLLGGTLQRSLQLCRDPLTQCPWQAKWGLSGQSLNSSRKECLDWNKHRHCFFPFPSPLGTDRSRLRTAVVQICSLTWEGSGTESSQLLWSRFTRGRFGAPLPFESIRDLILC